MKVLAVSTPNAGRTATCLRTALMLRMVTIVSTTKAGMTVTCLRTA